MRLVHYARPPNLWCEDLAERCNQIFSSGQLTNFGPWCQAVENTLSETCRRHVCITSSGTTALAIMMRWLVEQEPVRRHVALPAFTFGAAAQAAILAGCSIAWYDTDADLLPKESDIKALVKRPDIIALVLSPCFGFQFSDMFEFARAIDPQIPVIFDSAHFLGADENHADKFQQGIGHALSFSATKIVAAAGGGAVVGGNLLVEFAKRARNYGMANGVCVQWGLNGKASEIDCAIISESLKRMAFSRKHRHQIATTYISAFSSVAEIELFPRVNRGEIPLKEMPLLLRGGLASCRDDLLTLLSERGVEAKLYFWPALNQHRAFRGTAVSTLANSEDIARRIVCLPISERVSIDDVNYVNAMFLESIGELRQRNFATVSV